MSGRGTTGPPRASEQTNLILRELWTTSSLEDLFQVICHGVTAFAGWHLAALNIRQHDDLVVVATAGDEDFVRSALGRTRPVSRLEDIIASGTPYGPLVFIDHDRQVGREHMTLWTVYEDARPDTPRVDVHGQGGHRPVYGQFPVPVGVGAPVEGLPRLLNGLPHLPLGRRRGFLPGVRRPR